MDTLRSLPLHFWWLCAGCAIGFGLLWWATLGRRRWRRLAQLRQALAAVAGTDAGNGPTGRWPPAMADTSRPAFLFIGDSASHVQGLFAAGGMQALDEPIAGSPWRTASHPAFTPIVLRADLMQDAAAPDARRLWLQGLMALTAQRPALPLNGIVVCVAARALPHAPPPIAALVHEAAQLLQVQLPIYLVVTGLEHLPGHAQVCAGLPAEVLAQALGHRFPEPPSRDAGPTAAQQLDAAFGAMSPRLEALAAALMRDLAQPAARLAILQWTDHVLALQAGLRPLLEQLFEPASPARWRGLFFTAAAGEASPGAFAADLFARFLPEDQALARSTERP